ncbi:hypothetical protein DL766_000157 [Monosporascus sp. MC13-8B]|nr:hypothetical protein DL763_004759 [Monosporascus cannonballus]RYP39948.1 hypothetical protein DL766_000157 [Monosporascus sp. MC13-8B]
MRRRKRDGKILNPEERRRILAEQHDPKKFDSYIYGKANEPFRPGSKLFNVPWYEQPARPARPATSFGYLDPRVHWSEPRPPQWFERKRKEVSERGGRKANFGRAAASAARRKLEDQRANRWVGLPERVKSNQKWLAALDEMDELAEANRLRSLGLLGSGTTSSSGRNNHKPKPRRRRKREKRREEQEQEHGQGQGQETVEAPQAPQTVEQQQEEEERVQADAEAEEHESPSKARLQRSRRRKKGKARATVIIDDEDDWAGGDGDDEYMEMDSD